MQPKWEHPRLGSFDYNESAWVRKVEVPAFGVFSYDLGDDRSASRCDLSFDANDPEQIPSEAAVEMAVEILANAADMATKVCQALWDDFNGSGPRSSIWWHGDLEAVTEDLEEFEFDDDELDDDYDWPMHRLLAGPEEILPLMRIAGIAIRRTDDLPIAELMFHAAFEPEHGVGILTDGTTILGTGYMVTVRPFRDNR